MISLPQLDRPENELVKENLILKKRLAMAESQFTLLKSTIRIFGFQIQYQRLPSAPDKENIISAIRQARKFLPLLVCLETIGLSIQRFQHWRKKQIQCLLQDQSSCPRSVPFRLTQDELMSIKHFYTSKEYAHFSVLSLSLLAKRMGRVFAAPSTWRKVVQDLGLKKPSKRIYPPKPKLGIRATFPNQLWHMDMSIIRAQDNTKVFIQSIIDNYSRCVLAWKVSTSYGGKHTTNLIKEAIRFAHESGFRGSPTIMMDKGCENINNDVDRLVEVKAIKRIIAQIDIAFSNSMVERLFYRLKHKHLYNIYLGQFHDVEKAVSFYFNESNHNIPLLALKGATPIEVYSGSWTNGKVTELRKQSTEARARRLKINQTFSCGSC